MFFMPKAHAPIPGSLLVPPAASLLATRIHSSTIPTLLFSHLLSKFLAKILEDKKINSNVFNGSSGNCQIILIFLDMVPGTGKTLVATFL